MPTNFTYDLYAGNEMTFPEYAMRCARASGMLAGMRDDPIDAVIPDEFEANSYYIEQLEKARANVARINKWDDAEAGRYAQYIYDRERCRYEEELFNKAVLRERYEAMLEKARAWTPPTPKHQKLKEIMIQQLEESIDFDCSTDHLTAPVLPTDVAFKEEALRTARQEVSYYTKCCKEDEERAKERTEWIKALRQSLAAPSDAPPEA